VQEPGSDVGRPIVIVSGLPRSGTSMMMQMLSAGGLPALTDNFREADEDNPRGYYEFERVKQVREDQSWLEGARGRVVKMVYRLLYDLPSHYSYRVVFMRRDLNEVIASQEEMLRRLGRESGDVPANQLAAIYRRQLAEVEAWLEEQPNFEVLYVEYGDVLTDPPGVASRLHAFLGDGLDLEAMQRVPDRALYRKRG
jgi:Sulfotransferase domain